MVPTVIDIPGCVCLLEHFMTVPTGTKNVPLFIPSSFMISHVRLMLLLYVTYVCLL